MKEVEVLASFVHGALASLHALGAVFNIRRGNKADAMIHIFVFLYDLWATHEHTRRR
jgi:hypothetical protein